MSVVASATTEFSALQSVAHGRQRRKERNIDKIDLQRAKRYGMVESARGGRLKYTYGGIVFIYDPATNTEITSYPSKDSALSTSGTRVAKPIILPKKDMAAISANVNTNTNVNVGVDLNKHFQTSSYAQHCLLREEEKRQIVEDKGSWSSHSVLVVDMSGSMRKDDVNGARCRSDAIFLSIARNYVQQPLMAKTRSKKDLITIITMKDDANVVIECEPTDWVLYNKLIDMREWSQLRPAGPGNYIPALDEAERMLMRNTRGGCALSLMFFSDGKPSDKCVSHEFSKRMGSIASKFGRRLTVSCVGMAESGTDFSILNEMAGEAQSFGAVASFGKPTLDADSLSNIISSLASSLTTTMTEITNVDTGKIREVRMDIRREKVNTPQDFCLTDEWTAYKASYRSINGRYVGSIWSWDYKLNDFVQCVDPRCSK